MTTPVGGGYKSVNVSLRQALDLYANLRPVKNLPNVASRYGDLDLVVVRENTEDLYSGIEHVVVPGVVESIKIITEKASTRIARFAFEYARTHGRRKITAVHKANIMKLSDGLFLDCFRKVAAEYVDIEANDVIVDAACMKLVMNPKQFDVLLLENLYGDIISDLASGLVGGLGITPGANLGTQCAVFESVHGSAPDIAGKGIANPTALLLSATMLLRHIGENERAARIERRPERGDGRRHREDPRRRRHRDDRGVRHGGHRRGSDAEARLPERGPPRRGSRRNDGPRGRGRASRADRPRLRRRRNVLDVPGRGRRRRREPVSPSRRTRSPTSSGRTSGSRARPASSATSASASS